MSNRKNQQKKPTAKNNESRKNKLFEALEAADTKEMDRMIR